jgi:hypothetical protein
MPQKPETVIGTHIFTLRSKNKDLEKLLDSYCTKAKGKYQELLPGREVKMLQNQNDFRKGETILIVKVTSVAIFCNSVNVFVEAKRPKGKFSNIVNVAATSLIL